MRHAKKALKILNPFIALVNFLNYQAHLESQCGAPAGRCEPYDFSRDLKYF